MLDATAAAGHLSSSSIYPACFAPYLINLACSDGTVRFLKCQVNDDLNQEMKTLPQLTFRWKEWEMMISSCSSSAIYLSGKFCVFIFSVSDTFLNICHVYNYVTRETSGFWMYSHRFTPFYYLELFPPTL